MSDYHRLLAREDAAARGGYDYDPRIAYHTQSRILRDETIPATNMGLPTRDLNDPAGFAGIPDGSHADSNITQTAPKTVSSKRYVIVDCAQRDWTVFPNPYSNVVFTFGGEGKIRAPTAVYTNNAIYPSFALPPSTSASAEIVPGAANTRGFSYIDPAGNQIDLSAYNSSLPRGNFVAFDSNISSQQNATAFGCPTTPCNVSAIRLVRAILPQTPFVAYPSDPVFAVDASSTKQAVTATPYNTFGTYPYLLFQLNDYRGQYYGPNETSRKAFAVLTQCNRAQIDFTLTNGPQYFDYVPWNNEALHFQSPITNLQKLQISVTDPHGSYFASTQPDNLTIDSIRLATTVSGGNVIVSRSTLICTTPSYKKYPETQLRVGDRVSFYSPALSNMLKSDILLANPQKRGFIGALIGQTFPVLFVQTYRYDASVGTYVVDLSANIPNLTDSRIDYFNAFFIPNFVTRSDDGTLTDIYPGAVDTAANNYSIVDVQTLLGAGCNLPALNVTQQPTYTFELDVLTPDTTDIGAKVVI